MKNYFLFQPLRLVTYASVLSLGSILSCSDENEMPVPPTKLDEKIVVANRSGGSISFVDVITNHTVKTLSIPGSEPMYVVYVPQKDKLYLGDRAAKKVHVVNPKNLEVEGSIDVGNGVFHMGADGQGRELWVANDIDNTISVINLSTNMVTNTINVDMKPHDVFLSQDGTTAFVSVFTGDPNSDKVYKYSTSTYSKTGEATVGKEPHLFHLANNRLYVPCQSGKVFILDSNSLNTISEKDYDGAHGIFPSPDQNTIFVSNITGNQLFSINAANGEAASAAVSTPVSTPHNIVVNKDGNRMYVTHSGASADMVSIYNIGTNNMISHLSTINVGNNPFGITYYKRSDN